MKKIEALFVESQTSLSSKNKKDLTRGTSPRNINNDKSKNDKSLNIREKVSPIKEQSQPQDIKSKITKSDKEDPKHHHYHTYQHHLHPPTPEDANNHHNHYIHKSPKEDNKLREDSFKPSSHKEDTISPLAIRVDSGGSKQQQMLQLHLQLPKDDLQQSNHRDSVSRHTREDSSKNDEPKESLSRSKLRDKQTQQLQRNSHRERDEKISTPSKQQQEDERIWEGDIVKISNDSLEDIKIKDMTNIVPKKSSLKHKRIDETTLKDLWKQLSLSEAKILEDDKIDFVISHLKCRPLKNWRKVKYSVKILTLITEYDHTFYMRNKLLKKGLIGLLFSLLTYESIHRTDEVKLYCLECLGHFAENPITHEEIVEQNDGITKLVAIFQSYRPDSPIGSSILKILKALFKSRYKETILKHGIDKNLFKVNRIKSMLDSIKLRKGAKQKLPPDHNDLRSVSAQYIIPAGRMNTSSYNTYNPPVLLSFNDKKQLKRKSAPNTKRNRNSVPGTSSLTVGSGPVIVPKLDIKGESPTPRITDLALDEVFLKSVQSDDIRKLPRSKSKRKTRLSSLRRENSKIRLKCRWDDDNHYIWVKKDITVEELLEAIMKEYNRTVVVGQVKYVDPADGRDLITITKREDIQLSFEGKRELHIINYPSTPRSNNLTPLTIPSIYSTPSSPTILNCQSDRSPSLITSLDDPRLLSVSEPSLFRMKQSTEETPLLLSPSTFSLPYVPDQKKLSPVKIDADLEGKKWIIHYQDLRFEDSRLGGGYFGEVRKGYWRGVPVACKFLYEKSFRKKSDIELFEQEVNILSSLRHPNIILYMGVCIDTKDKVIVMEYMERGSLYGYLRKESLTLEQIHKIDREIALGMNYLHGENILHRDLTSKNILLSKHMEAKVADFGLSKMKLAESQSLSDTIGSVAWMAPEVLLNANNFTKVSDVYSYGIITWELFTGEDPCPRDIAPVNFANMVLHDNYRPPLPVDVPIDWQELIQKCWYFNKADEIQKRPSFDQVLVFLEDIYPKKNQQSQKDEKIIVENTNSRNHNDYDDTVLLGADDYY